MMSGNNLLPDPILNKVYDTIGCTNVMFADTKEPIFCIISFLELK